MKSLIECTRINCQILNHYNVEYLIIGGTAVAIHGYPRLSISSDGSLLGKHDLDFWYNPSYKNYFNLIKALSDIGFKSNFLDEKAPNPKQSFFKYEFEEYKLDFLPIITGLDSFSKAYNNRFIVNLDGIEISVISLEDLITTKESSNREKDKTDIEMLRKNNPK